MSSIDWTSHAAKNRTLEIQNDPFTLDGMTIDTESNIEQHFRSNRRDFNKDTRCRIIFQSYILDASGRSSVMHCLHCRKDWKNTLHPKNHPNKTNKTRRSLPEKQVTFFYGLLPMDGPVLADQQKLIYISSVQLEDVV